MTDCSYTMVKFTWLDYFFLYAHLLFSMDETTQHTWSVCKFLFQKKGITLAHFNNPLFTSVEGSSHGTRRLIKHGISSLDGWAHEFDNQTPIVQSNNFYMLLKKNIYVYKRLWRLLPLKNRLLNCSIWPGTTQGRQIQWNIDVLQVERFFYFLGLIVLSSGECSLQAWFKMEITSSKTTFFRKK